MEEDKWYAVANNDRQRPSTRTSFGSHPIQMQVVFKECLWYKHVHLSQKWLKWVAACGCRGDDCNNATEPLVDDIDENDLTDQNISLSFPRHVLIFDTELNTVIRR